MKDIYLCVTYYHLLISMLKAIKSDIKPDLLLYSDDNNKMLIDNTELICRIRKSNLFNEIFIFDYSKLEKEYKNNSAFISSIKRYFLTKKVYKLYKFDFSKYNNTFIYNDMSLLGRILNQKKIFYTLIEDGTDSLKNNYDRFKSKRNIKYFIKYLLNFRDYGQSKFVNAIEVNDSTNMNIYNKKLIEKPKEIMFKTLTKSEKKKLLKVFLTNDNLKKYNNAIIILTQPLSEDKLLSSEIEKINLYSKIIDEYTKNDNNIIIKSHPREKTNYKKYFSNIKVFDDPFPIELINFYPVSVKKIITLSSTAINTIYNCEEKIFLGWEYLDKFKDGIRFERKK